MEEFWEKIRNQRQKFELMVHDGSPDHGLGYIIARDGRIGLYYLKMFKIKSLLVMKFY